MQWLIGRVEKQHRDLLIETAAKVAELRRELVNAEEMLDALLGLEHSEGAIAALKEAAEDDAAEEEEAANAERTITSRIYQHLSALEGGATTAPLVAKALGIENVQTVRGILARLARDQVITQVERGKYKRKEPDRDDVGF